MQNKFNALVSVESNVNEEAASVRLEREVCFLSAGLESNADVCIQYRMLKVEILSRDHVSCSVKLFLAISGTAPPFIISIKE